MPVTNCQFFLPNPLASLGGWITLQYIQNPEIFADVTYTWPLIDIGTIIKNFSEPSTTVAEAGIGRGKPRRAAHLERTTVAEIILGRITIAYFEEVTVVTISNIDQK